MKRRQFLTYTAQATAVISTATFAKAQTVSANEEVSVALIGCGTRGTHVARLMRQAPGARFVAVCDVYDNKAAAAKRRGRGGC